MIAILDFGSQTTHLIARRIKDLGIPAKIFPHDITFEEISLEKTKGVILSGGPAGVYEKEAPFCRLEILESGLPILGICYGFQLLVHGLGGKVEKSLRREYGPARIKILNSSALFSNLPTNLDVWMSHQDRVIKAPPQFHLLASTQEVQNVALGDEQRKIYGVQFHPEVSHTPQGPEILKNFVLKICNLKPLTKDIHLIPFLTQKIKDQIGREKAVCALSGGIDSSVAAVLTHRAIGKNLTCLYVDTGMMRKGETRQIISTFERHFRLNLKLVEAEKIFLKKLKGVTDPERKRKIIGQTFIRIFESEAKKLGKCPFLIQGTIYPDVIESQGTENSSKIKSHHNVAGLPKKHRFKLVEPLREFYKDEVRLIAQKLGFPKEIIHRQVFPGPGLAIRIIGEVTKKKLDLLQEADWIVREEIRMAKLEKSLWMAFAILTGVRTTAVMGDARVYGETIALRVIESRDAMTANWARLPYPLLDKISTRIINQVPGVSRVVYDITSKPPATMEWE